MGDPDEPSLRVLPDDVVARLESFHFWHEAPVVSAVLSPDSKTLVSLDSDGTVYGWDRAALCRLYRRQFLGPGYDRRRLSCSPDGRWIGLSQKDPSSVLLFETATGDEWGRLDSCAGHAFSKDGSVLAAWKGRIIRRWSTTDGAELPRLEESPADLIAAAFSPDGRSFVATIAEMHGPVIWDTRTARKVFQPEPNPRVPRATGLAVSPDGESLAVGSFWGVTLWTLEENRARIMGSLDAFGGPPLRFTSDGKGLIGFQRPKLIGLWRLSDGECIETWIFPSTFHGFFDLSEDGTLLILAIGPGINLDPIPAPELRGDAARSRGSITGAGFRVDGRALTWGDDGKAHLWEASTGRRLGIALLPHLPRMSLSKDGRIAASGDEDCSIRVWDPAGGEERLRVEGLPHIAAIDWSPDGKELIAGTERGLLSFWKIDGRKERLRIRTEGVGITALRWSPDGKSIAWGEASGAVAFADAGSGKEHLRYRPRGPQITALAFSPDSRSVATGDKDGAVRRWEDTIAGAPTLLGQSTRPITALAFSPDGRWVAGGCADGQITLWPAGSAAGRVDYTGHRQAVMSLAFSPDGTLLISAASERAAFVWKVPAAK